MKESRRTKYLYVISNPSFSGYYKVGVTSDFHQRLSSYNTGDPHRAYKIEYKPRQHGGFNGNVSRNAKPVSIGEVEYASITKAAKELSVSNGWLWKQLNDNNKPNYKYL